MTSVTDIRGPMVRRQDELRNASVFAMVEAVIRFAPVSRAELCRRTGLSAGTVSAVTGALQAKGYLVVGSVERTGGRPLERLSVNPQALRLGGAFPAGPGELHLMITDAAGAPLYTGSIPFAPAYGPQVAEQLADLLDELVRAAPEPLRRLDGLGVAFPGLVDTREGRVHWAGVTLDPPVEMGEILSRRLGIPVYIENLVNARARGERLYGDGRDVDDFAVLTPTLGLGQYVKGELWNPRGLNPEFRHFKLGLSDGPRCDCGAEGCLGVYAGPLSIVRQACERLDRPAPGFPDFLPVLDEVLRCAEEGDHGLAALFERAGRLTGLALANICNMFDPQRLIVVGASERLLDAIRQPLEDALSANVFPQGRTPEIRFKPDDWRMCAKGAVALAVERVVSSV